MSDESNPLDLRVRKIHMDFETQAAASGRGRKQFVQVKWGV